MIKPSLAEIENLAEQGLVIPVRKDILGDLLTPAAAFLRVAQGRRRVFLLESVEGGERLARYSFIGWDPFLSVRGKGETIWVEEQGEIIREKGRPLEKLRQLSKEFHPAPVQDLPPFTGEASATSRTIWFVSSKNSPCEPGMNWIWTTFT